MSWLDFRSSLWRAGKLPVVVQSILLYPRSSGINQETALIAGAGPLGKRACKAMLSGAWAGLKPLALIDDDESLRGLHYNGVEVVGAIAGLVSMIEQQRQAGEPIDQVWIALPLSATARIEELRLKLQDAATNVDFVPDLFGFNLASYKVDEIVGLPVMNMSAKSLRGGSAILKRAEDVLFSCILLIPLSPFLLIIAALIKGGSSGPVFFKQRY